MPLGKHVLLECRGPQAHLAEKALRQLMLEAAERAGATVLSTHFHQFGEGCGLTGVAVLAESHITVHQWPENDYAAFDIFMCGNTEPEQAAYVIAEAFPSCEISMQTLIRNPPGRLSPDGNKENHD